MSQVKFFAIPVGNQHPPTLSPPEINNIGSPMFPFCRVSKYQFFLVCLPVHLEKPVILKANRTSQFITSSKNPTVCGSDRQCTWVITAPEGFQVQLTTESFVFLSCPGSFIEIKDGPTCSSPMIGKFCGNEKPPLEICSLGNSLWISFKYNSTRDLEMNRFELMYRATRANITPQRKFYDEQAINSGKSQTYTVFVS